MGGESLMKPIQINPELFNMRKNKTQRNKSLKIRNVKPNKLKNDHFCGLNLTN